MNFGLRPLDGNAPARDAEFFREILACTNLGILVLLPDRRILWANENLPLLLPFLEDAGPERTLDELLPEPLRKPFDRILRQIEESGFSPLEGVRWPPTGESCLGISGNVLRARHGGPGLRLLIVQDLFLYTEVKDLDTRLGQSMRLLSIASHEIRNPLTTILGFAEILLDRDLPQEQRKFLERILGQGRRIDTLLEEIRAASRSRTGVFQLHMREISLESILKAVVEDFGAREAARSIRLTIPPSFPGIRGDGGKLTQVFQNLVDNACKYSPPSAPVDIEARAIGPDLMEVAVRDRGPGIPSEHLPRLFECFFRVPGAPTQNVRGSGIGLFLIKQFVEAHGGTVSVESEPGTGSVFRVILPTGGRPPEAGSGPLPSGSPPDPKRLQGY